MKIYIVINREEIDASKVIQAVFTLKSDAKTYWEEFRSERFHYEITEHEAVE